MNKKVVEKYITQFLEEDLGAFGDPAAYGLKGKIITAYVEVKSPCILAGNDFFELTFDILGSVKVSWAKEEGQFCAEGEIVCQLKGDAFSILSGERTALNLLQRLSGIATLTSSFVSKLQGSKVKLLDTRKTTPGLRFFEKHAVRVGGGYNHRFTVFDTVMVKDNHIAAYGGLREAVLFAYHSKSPMSKLEVEVDSMELLNVALESEVLSKIDIIMLDNWPLEEIERAVSLIKGAKPETAVEISGGVDLSSIEFLKDVGADFISTSALITKAKWADMSLEVVNQLL